MNDVLPTLLGIALVAAAAAFALVPFLRPTRLAPSVPASAASERARIYQQVLELEFDHQLGKLSIEDYEQLSAELLAQAGASLRTERGVLTELDDELEREIAAARAAFAAAREVAGRSRRPVRSA